MEPSEDKVDAPPPVEKRVKFFPKASALGFKFVPSVVGLCPPFFTVPLLLRGSLVVRSIGATKPVRNLFMNRRCVMVWKNRCSCGMQPIFHKLFVDFFSFS